METQATSNTTRPRYEVEAIISGMKTVYQANEIDFELGGFVNIIPMMVNTPEKKWPTRNVIVKLPVHVIQSITEYKQSSQ